MYLKINYSTPPLYIYTPRGQRPRIENREKRDDLGCF